jgi:hypothetical protein
MTNESWKNPWKLTAINPEARLAVLGADVLVGLPGFVHLLAPGLPTLIARAADPRDDRQA